MSDDRDLDELLESLDALLREGESHNDDAEETDTLQQITAAEKKHAKSLPAEPEPEALTGTESKGAAAPAGSVEQLSAEAEESSDEEEAELPHFLVEGEQTPEEEELQEVAEETADSEGAEAAPVHRVILTEEMLVDNHQESLPLKPAGSGDAETGNEVSAANSSSLSDEQMQQLAAQVRRDITRQLQAKLPQWIEQSIKKHLQSSTDQTKE